MIQKNSRSGLLMLPTEELFLRFFSDNSPLWGESIGRRPIGGGSNTTDHQPNSHVDQEPPTSSLPSLTPPKGEGVQKRGVSPPLGGTLARQACGE